MKTTFSLQIKKNGTTTDLYFVSNGEIIGYIREQVASTFAVDVKDMRCGARMSYNYIAKAKDGYNLLDMVKAVESANSSKIGTCLANHGSLVIDGQAVIFTVLTIAAPGQYLGFGSMTKAQNAKIAKQLASATYSI